MKQTKKFLYITTMLMIVALAWGIVDFAIAEKNGTNKKLYQANDVLVKKDTIDKQLQFEDFSRGIIEAKYDSIEMKKVVNKKQPEIKMETLPKLDDIKFSSFSRGKIMRRFEPPKIMPTDSAKEIDENAEMYIDSAVAVVDTLQ